MSKEEVLINEEINLSEVRCISDSGEVYGVMSSREALEIAVREDLDLVLISPNATPHVCTVMDYGKFRYHQEKRQKEARKST